MIHSKSHQYSKVEEKLLRSLNSPQKIQDYVNTLRMSSGRDKDGTEMICMSPRLVLRTGTAHCAEGALFASAALEFHGAKPLLLDLRSTRDDFDHVVAVFKQFGCFGAVSKTSHAVLRYREPIYKTVRELVLSYFHEYFDNTTGRKNLREYSTLINLNYFNHMNWRTSEKDLFELLSDINDMPHHHILSKKQIKNLRRAEPIEIKAGKIVEK